MRTSPWMLVCAALLAYAPSMWAQSGDLARPIVAGATTISGVISPAPMADTAVTIEVTAPSDANPPGPRRVISRQQTLAAAKTGAFTLTLPAGVRVGYEVNLIDPATMMRRDQVAIPALAMPVIPGPVVAGSRGIEGTAEKEAKVRVTVRPPLRRQNDDDATYLQRVEVTSDATGKFQAVLPSPVMGSHRVEVVEFFGTDRSPAAEIVVSDPGDWGRTRAYFAGGAVFSKKGHNFSEQDLAVTFALDKSWFLDQAMTLPPRDQKIELASGAAQPQAATTQAATPRAKVAGRARLKPRQLNTFFDARLTALPVAQETSTEKTSTATPTAVPVKSNVDKFIGSEKGAVVQIGIYAPMYGPSTTWVHEGRLNTLFNAPVGRFGIQTITETPSSSQTTNTTTNAGTDTTVTTTKAAGAADDVFYFWSVGWGLGHSRLTGTRDEAPELISYLHVTVGHSQAFETKDDHGNPKRPVRVFVEGRLKIPDTAMQIGFDANLGRGDDDVRFVFGTRFDLGAVIGRMKQIN